MKAKSVSVFIISIFSVFFACSSTVSATISSRIEGIVSDKDTGKPIPGALAILYTMEMGMRGTCKTDSKGYFRFDKLWLREGDKYYLRCIAVGYVPRIPEYYFTNVKLPYFDEVYQPFTVDEGQIKHIKINLGKGGSLSGQIFLKVPSGVSAFKDVTLFLLKKKKPNECFLEDNVERYSVDSIHTDEEGKFKFIDLEPSDDAITDEYVIKLKKSGYYNMPFIRGIKIKKSEQSYLEFTVNFTEPTGIKGTVRINGKIPLKGDALLESQSPNDIGSYETIVGDIDANGNYEFLGIPPGKYKLKILAYYAWNKSSEEFRIVEIVNRTIKVLDFNFEVLE